MTQTVKHYPDLPIAPSSMEKYRQVVRQIFATYHSYTPLMEPLSLDEACLGVTNSPLLMGNGTRIIEDIRRCVREETGIIISAGVAPNKLTAKIASDWNKPDGLFIVRSEQIDGFVAELPVDHLFGMGKMMAAELRRLGVETYDDSHVQGTDRLQQYFGVFGFRLHDFCHDTDHRQVQPPQIRKLVSVEETHAADLRVFDDYQHELSIFVEQLAVCIEHVRVGNMIHKTHVKLRFADFRGTVVECTSPQVSLPVLFKLPTQGFERRGIPVRLLGVGVRLYESDARAHQQLSFAENSAAAD